MNKKTKAPLQPSHCFTFKALDIPVAELLQKIDKPIEKADFLEAGLIILRKLNADEISFLFGISDKNYTKEELIEVRRVLLSKLNDNDIKTLRSLAQKYGKKLDILDPNVPIDP